MVVDILVFLTYFGIAYGVLYIKNARKPEYDRLDDKQMLKRAAKWGVALFAIYFLVNVFL